MRTLPLMTWEPITLEALYDKILAAEDEMMGEISRFWELIQVFPEKWQQVPYGEEGNGFWVVTICGKQII